MMVRTEAGHVCPPVASVAQSLSVGFAGVPLQLLSIRISAKSLNRPSGLWNSSDASRQSTATVSCVGLNWTTKAAGSNAVVLVGGGSAGGRGEARPLGAHH